MEINEMEELSKREETRKPLKNILLGITSVCVVTMTVLLTYILIKYFVSDIKDFNEIVTEQYKWIFTIPSILAFICTFASFFISTKDIGNIKSDLKLSQEAVRHFQVTSNSMSAKVLDISAQMIEMKSDYEQLRRNLAGETPEDYFFAKIFNHAVDYLKGCDEGRVVEIRGFLLYIYDGNSKKIKDQIRNISPRSKKMPERPIINFGNMVNAPNAETVEQKDI